MTRKAKSPSLFEDLPAHGQLIPAADHHELGQVQRHTQLRAALRHHGAVCGAHFSLAKTDEHGKPEDTVVLSDLGELAARLHIRLVESPVAGANRASGLDGQAVLALDASPRDAIRLANAAGQDAALWISDTGDHVPLQCAYAPGVVAMLTTSPETRWAAFLYPDQLEALLWAIGEVGLRVWDVVGVPREGAGERPSVPGHVLTLARIVGKGELESSAALAGTFYARAVAKAVANAKYTRWAKALSMSRFTEILHLCAWEPIPIPATGSRAEKIAMRNQTEARWGSGNPCRMYLGLKTISEFVAGMPIGVERLRARLRGEAESRSYVATRNCGGVL